MPLYMDRHNIPQDITAEHVAQMHQEDLKIEHLYGCKGMTYWCDEARKTAFCLIEAPNEDAIREMHQNAHGDVPHKIIEVNAGIVESFLGRIEDPAPLKSEEQLIKDSAFRIVMIAQTNQILCTDEVKSKLRRVLHKNLDLTKETIKNYNGNVVNYDLYKCMASFTSVTQAVLCAITIHSNFKNLSKKVDYPLLELNIGLSTGDPVTNTPDFFEDTIKMTQWLCEVIDGQIVVSPEVRYSYDKENKNDLNENKSVIALNPSEEKFLENLMQFTEKLWNQTNLKVEDFCAHLCCSKAKFYRNMIALTGKSPNTFLKDYRLKRALKMLSVQGGNVSQVAFDSGFNTPSYFSKCFQEAYGMSPSACAKFFI
ncbi:nickel-binding protein [Leeuwenhoekiella sp. A16]|uniref:nickel-binding protein n=1 Tax=Leeuwenhoekiella sp. A16 TaxID=3141462 RepID=UPI003A812D7F